MRPQLHATLFLSYTFLLDPIPTHLVIVPTPRTEVPPTPGRGSRTRRRQGVIGLGDVGHGAAAARDRQVTTARRRRRRRCHVEWHVVEAPVRRAGDLAVAPAARGLCGDRPAPPARAGRRRSGSSIGSGGDAAIIPIARGRLTLTVSLVGDDVAVICVCTWRTTMMLVTKIARAAIVVQAIVQSIVQVRVQVTV